MNTNTNLLLRELGSDDELAFLTGLADWPSQESDWFTFEWKSGMSHEQHLNALASRKVKANLKPGQVPSTMLYAFVDGRIVGRISIRHELNENLLDRGGHVGYSVNPPFRKRGYGAEILKQGLIYCRNLGLEKILVTCGNDNLASIKMIENCGGSLEDRRLDAKSQEYFRRYWIDLVSNQFNPAAVAKKAVAYITRQVSGGTQLLVFDHDEIYQDAGTQVICGTIENDENPEATVLREIVEESGLIGSTIIKKIDEYQFFGTYSGRFIRRHAFHIAVASDTPDRWTHRVSGDGDDQGMNFHYYWIDCQEAKDRLSGSFEISLDMLG